MDAFDLDVRRHVYFSVVANGRPPTTAEVAAAFAIDEGVAESTYRRLHDAHALPLVTAPAGFVREIGAGIVAIHSDPNTRVLVLALGLSMLLVGMLDVLGVVLALDVLDAGEEAVGLLAGASGAGGLLGAGLAISLVGRRRLVGSLLASALLVGIGIGAVIHGFVPTGLVVSIGGSGNPLAVPALVLLGVPLYSNAAGTIPIIEVLIAKGLPMGSALAFMMAITALSFPEMVILRRVMKPRLIAVFAGVVAAGILFVGYLFNALYA